jgi:hypothetical protein
MSAYSFLNHRMFVAALSPAPAGDSRREFNPPPGPARSAAVKTVTAMLRPPGAAEPLPGVLLATALAQGCQAAAS